MKLPFDLGVKFIFRLVAPGFVLALGLYPLLAGLRDASGVTAPVEYIFIVSILIAGWLMILLDQPIYMLFEGRRFWPRADNSAPHHWTSQRRYHGAYRTVTRLYRIYDHIAGNR